MRKKVLFTFGGEQHVEHTAESDEDLDHLTAMIDRGEAFMNGDTRSAVLIYLVGEGPSVLFRRQSRTLRRLRTTIRARL